MKPQARATPRKEYTRPREKGKKIACTASCAQFWPPLLIKRGVKPTAGSGLDPKKLGTIRRPNGRFQVTYAGLALYTRTGFTRVGIYREQGLLDGKWVDVVVMEKLL